MELPLSLRLELPFLVAGFGMATPDTDERDPTEP